MSQNHQDNPLLHPPFYVIPGISPNAPVSAQVQQIDQRNTLLLQEIDANFAKFHQVITSKILPEIKRFAIGSEPVREASQFWRSFFETAAANRVNLEGDTTASGQESHQEASNSQHQYDDHTVTSDHLSQIHNDDASFMFATSSTPLPGRGHPGQSGTREGMRNGVDESWEDSLDSPFDRMDRRLHDLKFTNSNDEISSDMPTPSLPSGYSMPRMDGTGSSSINELSIADYSTGTVERKDIPESHPRQMLQPRSQDGGRSSHYSRRQRDEDYNSGDTPKAKYGNYRVTDLRTTPLNARFSKASSSGQGKGKEKARAPQQAKIPYMDPLADFSDDDDDDLVRMAMSPPVTMNFSLPPRAQAIMQAGKTPVKSRPPSAPSSKAPHQTFEEELSRQDAPTKDEGEARMILDDLLEEMSTSNYEPSPRMPTPEGLGRYSIAPGDIGTSARLLFQDDQRSERQATRRSVGANTSYGSDIITQSDQPTPYGDDEESFDEDSFDSDAGQTVHNPGQYDHPGRQPHLDADDTFMSNSPETQRYAYPAQNTDGYSTGGYSTSGQSGNTAQMVFGNPPRQPKQSINSSSGHALGAQDGFLMKQDEMMTIWGGKLEDAAGAEVAETPSQAPRRRPNGDKLLL